MDVYLDKTTLASHKKLPTATYLFRQALLSIVVGSSRRPIAIDVRLGTDTLVGLHQSRQGRLTARR